METPHNRVGIEVTRSRTSQEEHEEYEVARTHSSVSYIPECVVLPVLSSSKEATFDRPPEVEQGNEIVCTNVSLIYTKHEHVSLRYYFDEPQIKETFLKMVDDIHILLDLHESRAEAILDELFRLLLPDSATSTVIMDKLMNSIFTHDQLRQINRTVQGLREFKGEYDYDHNWVCAISLTSLVTEPRLGIARLKVPANIGRNCQECRFVILIMASKKLAGTRFEFEKAQMFGTLMSDPDLRNSLQDARSPEIFKELFFTRASDISSMFPDSIRSIFSVAPESRKVLSMRTDEISSMSPDTKSYFSRIPEPLEKVMIRCSFMRGLIADVRRRWPHYWSDFKDGICDKKSVAKTLSCTMLLYFICLLPSIAFGVLNAYNTKGNLSVEKVLLSQTIGGLVFAFIGGTTQIVLLTTAPLAIYANIVYKISQEYGFNFRDLYACVGLWNAFFLILYSVFDLSLLMQYSTRSSEEIFAFFISVAFAVDACSSAAANFRKHYFADECQKSYNRTAAVETLTQAYRNESALPEGHPKTIEEALASLPQCQREISILYLLLMLGTVWVGITLYNFTRTPYLTATKRELIADYSLPISVIVMSFIGYFLFQDVNISRSFIVTSEALFLVPDMASLTLGSVFGSMGLGFCLSLLFFMDQNISAAMVNAPKNKLKKGTSYHWDLMVVALINVAPSIFTFPMVHAALPHSPLHLRALADVEERVMDGHVKETVVRVRETRVAAILSHIMIGASLALTSFLAYIPGAVLYGLFLYVAITPLYDNQMFERVLLLFTEEAAYPPTYYVRRVPLRKVHLFTLLQILQLLALCGAGFSGVNYLKLIFPILIFLLIPFRHYCMPLIVDLRYIKALDYEF